MNTVKEAPRSLGRTEQKNSVEGLSARIGWDVAVLVILGSTLAVVGMGLLVVGSLMH